jgi:hypothetical protein
MLSGLAGAPPPPVPGALEDDPLTSPSFSLKADPATDSRSYSHARKASRAVPGNGNGSPGSLASDPVASNGASHTGRHDSGSYPTADYASPTYTYPEPAPVPAAPAVPAEWYSSPPAEPAPTAAYGNPYSYPGASTAGASASPAADPGYGGYLPDPLHTYSPPPYESPVPAYPDPSGASYQSLPTLGVPGGPGYPEAYPQHPYGQDQGQPNPPQYPDAAGGNGYAASYDGGYGGDPYAAGEYGTYPSQG